MARYPGESAVKRTILTYALVLVAVAFLLQWLEYRFLVRSIPFEGYAMLVGALFLGLGLWAGIRMARPQPAAPFEVNRPAMLELGISERELEVLDMLSEGLSNRQLADRLHISENTVKTHLKRVNEKLEVTRRGEAVQKARSLRLIR